MRRRSDFISMHFSSSGKLRKENHSYKLVIYIRESLHLSEGNLVRATSHPYDNIIGQVSIFSNEY